MTDKPLIVIPVKTFHLAKSRLGRRLSPDRRSALARRLCERTLRFLARNFPDHDRLVVTASPAIARLARRHGAEVLKEPAAEGLSVAAQRAADWARRRGYPAQLLLPADIVQLDAEEIHRLLATRAGHPGIALCPASDGGTNALLTSPPDVLTFRFGPASAAAHREEARRRGLPCRVLAMDHLSFDLDTPKDLNTLDALIRGNRGETPQELKTLWKLCMTPAEMTPWAAWLTTP
ncbi:2-phospho-L-lactate guanylyltransferase [uncultured Halomonas sp.]|uniref:2-phospho-L-lactate guanylyltransferase n=1 Tax=uncultured Halomonas sp. TaxID=173971 RepID=UPI0026191B0D|nr:2-phospho-L-lactate guanylyltransferase [uncultured Halomonas sp.]